MEPPVYSKDERLGMVSGTSVPTSTITGMFDDTFASTYDKAYRAKDPLRASQNSFDRFDPFKNSMGNRIADYIREPLNTVGKTTGNLYRSGYLGAGAAGAGAGVLAGVLLNQIMKRRNPDGEGMGNMKAGLLGALALGGGALLAHHSNRDIIKNAFSLDLSTVVTSVPGLSQAEKTALVTGVQQLSANEKQELSRRLRGVTGAAIGSIIGKFLLSKGLLGPIAGAIIGGLLGLGSYSTRTNALGQTYKPYNF